MKRLKNRWCRLALLSVVLIFAGELYARYFLGLGTPPLSIAHPQIEYMFKPNQDVYRFGNHFVTNSYGMRSQEFPYKKEVGEFRIMVFGDSVVNGGNLTDNDDLATTIIQKEFSGRIKDKVIVGHISAGSWGPGNWLAYAKTFGFFEADVVVLVISSHDYIDNPTFKPLNEGTHPTKQPLSALVEGVTRYLPRYLPEMHEKETLGAEPPKIQRGLGDLAEFLEMAKNHSEHVLVFQHWGKSEIESGSGTAGHEEIKAVCDRLKIDAIPLYNYFHQVMMAGQNPYRDNIHPNQIGQKILAEAIIDRLARIEGLK